MGIAIIIAQFILSLSILIVLHEFGHFLPAKWFKTRVEKFYLFFDPWFSLFKVKRGDTEYGIGWLPLGGYVKISGMIDESMDTEQMKLPPQPWEFRSKPAWQRLIIMLGGVTVNFILGFFIFGMILFAYGREYLPVENAPYGIMVDSLGYEMGLRSGDKILTIGDEKFVEFNDRKLIREIVINDANRVTVERNGNTQEIEIDEEFVGILSSSANKNLVLFVPRVPYIASAFSKGSIAEEAGIKIGDHIISLNGQPTPYFDNFKEKFLEYTGGEVQVGVLRDNSYGSKDTLSFAMAFNETRQIGVYYKDDIFETRRETYTLMQALPKGVTQGYDFLADQIKAFGQMFRGKIKASDSLGGFGTIGGLFPRVWDWERFWFVTAILSLILGFMNLLPIPALDGGHVMFLLWEVVTGRKPSDKVMEISTMIGFALIIALVLYANGLDILRFFNK